MKVNTQKVYSIAGEPPSGNSNPLQIFNNQTSSDSVQLQNEKSIEKSVGQIITGDRNPGKEASIIERQDTAAPKKITKS